MFTLIIEDRTGNVVDEFSFEQGSYSLGRVEGNDIILQSNSVSRQHARIFVANSRCFIEDLDSSNGVVLNGERIKSRTELGNSTRVQLGDFILYLEVSKADRPSGGVHTHVVGADASAFKLVRVGDMFAGEEFTLTEPENSIGRTDENFILLSDQSISRKHALIVRTDDAYTIQDLGSSNGTKLNGKSAKKPSSLRAGDEVQFGNVRFVFAPGNQPVDLQAYANPTYRPQGTTLALGLVLVLLLGVAIAFLIYFFVLNRAPKHADDASSSVTADSPTSDPDATSPSTSPDPTAPGTAPPKAAFDIDGAAAGIKQLIIDRTPARALTAIQALPPEVAADPRIELLKASALLLDNERKTFESALDKQKEGHLDAARALLLTINTESAFFDDAARELALINAQLSDRLYEEAKKQCATKLDDACISQLCKPLTVIPAHTLTRKMLADLSSDKKLAKPIKQKIQECLDANPLAPEPPPTPPPAPEPPPTDAAPDASP